MRATKCPRCQQRLTLAANLNVLACPTCGTRLQVREKNATGSSNERPGFTLTDDPAGNPHLILDPDTVARYRRLRNPADLTRIFWLLGASGAGFMAVRQVTELLLGQ